METTKSLVHAFITSKVDYCNSLLYGVPKYLLLRLQREINCAARIVFKARFKRRTFHVPNLIPIWVDPNN